MTISAGMRPGEQITGRWSSPPAVITLVILDDGSGFWRISNGGAFYVCSDIYRYRINGD